MADKLWRFELEDGWHSVELHHIQTWGRRRIRIDGKTVVSHLTPFDFSQRYELKIGDHAICVSIIFGLPIRYTYELYIDNEPLVEDSVRDSLLRASRPPQAASGELLRAAGPGETSGPDDLLRAGCESDTSVQ